MLQNLIKQLIKRGIKTAKNLEAAKRRWAKKSKIPLPTNVHLLQAYHNLIKSGKVEENKDLEKLLRRKKVRSLSGIVVVSVLTKPYPCPGNCLYCPTQEGIPKSYLNNEPAVMRAIANRFDPYLQVQSRLKTLQETGHPTDKIELIVIGGTWSYLPKNYQTWFIRRCFEACNTFKNSKFQIPCLRRARLPDGQGFGGQANYKQIQNSKSKTLKEIQENNEAAKHRIIGITLETRPDFINEKEIKWMRELGATRVEIGAQSIYDDVLKLNNRGHFVKAVIEATRLLKDAGFKICYHMMPNLPGSNLRKDEKMFEELFSNQDFQPDLLKIYPCAVLKEAPLYQLWKTKKYRPYSEKELINLLISIKKKIPFYCRIQRLIRDIPSQNIVAGCKITNLREVLAQRGKKEGWRCRCIRCREIKDDYSPRQKPILFRIDYEASGGKEIFLSYEDKNRKKLYSLLRLRIPSCVYSPKKHFIPILKNAALIREVHTYGQLVSIGKKENKAQHSGLGKKLIKEAERIAKKEFNLPKIAAISGIGVRNYYRKLGYRLKDTYMLKTL